MPDTQMTYAARGTITDAVGRVAADEAFDPAALSREVAAGHAVIPANPAHAGLQPIGIGRRLRTKINANIGNSTQTSDVERELEKLRVSIRQGADTVMDLSTGEAIDTIRAEILRHSSVPVGTVPIYQALAKVDDPMQLDIDLLLDVMAFQARQGVDFMTLHAGLLRAHVPEAKKRLAGIVSRGGAILAKWMTTHRRENPLYEHFDRVLEICRQHDVTLSLGDGLRPGCLADASDRAQFAELEVLGELVRRSRAAGVQAMVEGPGHVPLDQIEMNMRRERELCDDAPFYILGPLVTDCAAGHDHIAAAIGATLGAYHGAAMLCYVTPKEHLGLPNLHDVREGVAAFKIAAHAADVALKKAGARERDDAMSRARVAFDWERQFALALDPERARALRAESLAECNIRGAASGPCTMCGPKFCSMKISGEIPA